MPVPFPTDEEVLLQPPDAAEARHIAGGVAAAAAPAAGLTQLQRVLIESVTESMTGFVGPGRRGREARSGGVRARHGAPRRGIPVAHGAVHAARRARARAAAARSRANGSRPTPRELGVDDALLRVAQRYARGSLGLALIDFQRSGYMETWDPAHTEQLHTSRALDEAWEMRCDDPELAAQWAALRGLSRRLARAGHRALLRGARLLVPWPAAAARRRCSRSTTGCTCSTDYGSTVECEIEVFGFIARANDDPRGFSLLAMVVSLFETGYLPSAAGLFAYDRGHLSEEGHAGPARRRDAPRRAVRRARGRPRPAGASTGSTYADRPIAEVRAEFGIVEKSERAIAAGSVDPW